MPRCESGRRGIAVPLTEMGKQRSSLREKEDTRLFWATRDREVWVAVRRRWSCSLGSGVGLGSRVRDGNPGGR